MMQKGSFHPSISIFIALYFLSLLSLSGFAATRLVICQVKAQPSLPERVHLERANSL